MNNLKNPHIPSSFILGPEHGDTYITDSWTSLFALSETSESDALAKFPKETARYIGEMGYDGDVDGEPSMVSFSDGVIGIGRRMLVFSNHNAKAIVYFKPIHDYYYVSLRVGFRQTFSLMKCLRFIFTTVLLSLLTFVADYLRYDPQFANSGIMVATLLAKLFCFVGLFSLSIFVMHGTASWWRNGRFLAFLCKDFNEIYQDDIGSIGHAVHAAIMLTADKLSLKSALPEETASPSFDTNADAARSRRLRL